MEIHLINSDKIGIIDNVDYEIVSKRIWRLQLFKNEYYIVSSDKDCVCLHRFIMKINDSNIIIDHKDRNTLNNRRDNLRIATLSQNNANRKVFSGKSDSQFKGVHLDKGKYWFASVKKDGIQKIQYCKTEKDAAMKYNEMAIIAHGEFAALNVFA